MNTDEDEEDEEMSDEEASPEAQYEINCLQIFMIFL
jgi:hypothetical protein